MRSLLFFVLCANVLAADDRFVAPDGSDSNDGLSRKTAFRTLRAACRATPSGKHTIRVAAGEYEEEQGCVLPPGVSLTGEGIGKTLFHWKAVRDLENNPMGYDFDAFLIRMQDSACATISGLTITGSMPGDKRAHGGIIAREVSNVQIHDCELIGIEFTGVWLSNAIRSSVHHCVFNDCGHPSKQSCSGALQLGALTDCAIHHNAIREKRGAYGIKTWVPFWAVLGGNFTAQEANWAELARTKVKLERVHIHDNDIKVRQQGAWGNGQPNMAMELWNSNPSECEIYGNRFNECVSLVEGGDAPKTIRVHHNLFILEPGYSYAIEAGHHNMEIDHNVFRNGIDPIASFGPPVHGLRIHDNTFDGIENIGLCALPGVQDYRFSNNTVVMKKDQSVLCLGANNVSRNIAIVDNLFVLDGPGPARAGLIQSRKGATIEPQSLTIKGNAFWNWTPEGDDAMTADPMFERAESGDRLLGMSPKSPVRAAGKGAKP